MSCTSAGRPCCLFWTVDGSALMCSTGLYVTVTALWHLWGLCVSFLAEHNGLPSQVSARPTPPPSTSPSCLLGSHPPPITSGNRGVGQLRWQ